MASVCRTLPDFDASSDEINQFGTLKEQLVHRFVSGGQDDTKREDPELRIRELWGAGGPLTTMALQTTRRADTPAKQSGGYLETALYSIQDAFSRSFGGDVDTELDSEPVTDLIHLMDSILKDPDSSPVLSSGMGALVVFAHKRLSLANILVDQMGSMWLFEVITIHESLFALV